MPNDQYFWPPVCMTVPMARSSAKRPAFFVTNLYDCTHGEVICNATSIFRQTEVIRTRGTSVFGSCIPEFVSRTRSTTWTPNTSHNMGPAHVRQHGPRTRPPPVPTSTHVYIYICIHEIVIARVVEDGTIFLQELPTVATEASAMRVNP